MARFDEYREKPGTCAYCGNSPVNHLQAYIGFSLATWGSARLGRWNLLRAPRALSSYLADYLEPYLYRALAALPFSRFGTDSSKAATYRSQVIWEEAQRRGIEMAQLFVLGAATDIYRARVLGRTIYFQSLPTSLFQKAEDAWVDDKFLLKEKLAASGVRTPKSFSARTLREAQRAFEQLGAPVVVKPRVGSRGRHTTTGVRSGEALAEAFSSAKKICRYVSIEAHLDGPVCRATLVGGRLAGFFEAYPPRVCGDGASTIRELVEKHSREKPERVGDISLTDEHRSYLSLRGLSLESVLEQGREIALTHRTGRLFGGTTRELLGREHPRLRDELERAARVLPGPIVGFDLIVEDPERDPGEQRWGIIEGNSLPYIDLHYLPLQGEPSPVARDVWDWVLREIE